MRLRKIINIALLMGIAFLSGCASFEKNELTRVSALPDVSKYKNKPSVYIDLTFYRGEPGAPMAEMPQAKVQLMPHIEKAVADSNLFSRYTFDPSEKDSADYTIKIDSYNHGDMGAAAVMGFLTGFTFGVIPSAATDNYTVQLKAIDKRGKLVNEVSNKDAVKTWIGLWFIPLMGNTPIEAVSNTLVNQVRTALKELVESGSLKYSQNTIYTYPDKNG